MRARIALPLFILLLGLTTAWAQTSLSAKNVKSFVDCLEEAMPLLDLPDSSWEWDASDGRIPEKLNAVIAKYGFTRETWSETSSKVLNAYFSLKEAEVGEGMQQEMQQALFEVDNDASIPPEQKQEIVERLKDKQKEAQARLKNSLADQTLVRPYVARLDKLMERREPR